MTEKETVLITGSSRGIGAATARLLAAPGRAILVNFLSSASAAEEVCRDARARGAEARAVRADVTSAQQVDSLFGVVENDFGRLDVLVLNAGVPFQYRRLAETTPEEFERQWSSQARAAFLCCRRAVPMMARRKSGRIVLVLSSVVSGETPAFMAAYVSAKYALLGLSRALAAETSSLGIRVDVVLPGMTDTDFIAGFPGPIVEMAKDRHPEKRLERPEEAAAAIAELLRGKP